MLEVSNLVIIIIATAGVVGSLFVIVKRIYLSRIIWTTRIYAMEVDYTYHFQYVHGFALTKHFILALTANDQEKTYLVKETTYYSGKKDVQISVLHNSVIIYTIDLKNVVFYDNYKTGEEN